MSAGKATNQKRNWGDAAIRILAAVRKKRYVSSLCLMFGQTLFVRLATERSVWPTPCWTKMFARLLTRLNSLVHMGSI